MRVGFIGLGNMGEPLAGFVRKAGFDVVGCEIAGALKNVVALA